MSASDAPDFKTITASGNDPVEAYFECDLTDGLPIVPPTHEKVDPLTGVLGGNPDRVGMAMTEPPALLKALADHAAANRIEDPVRRKSGHRRPALMSVSVS